MSSTKQYLEELVRWREDEKAGSAWRRGGVALMTSAGLGGKAGGAGSATIGSCGAGGTCTPKCNAIVENAIGNCGGMRSRNYDHVPGFQTFDSDSQISFKIDRNRMKE